MRALLPCADSGTDAPVWARTHARAHTVLCRLLGLHATPWLTHVHSDCVHRVRPTSASAHTPGAAHQHTNGGDASLRRKRAAATRKCGVYQCCLHVRVCVCV